MTTAELLGVASWSGQSLPGEASSTLPHTRAAANATCGTETTVHGTESHAPLQPPFCRCTALLVWTCRRPLAVHGLASSAVQCSTSMCSSCSACMTQLAPHTLCLHLLHWVHGSVLELHVRGGVVWTDHVRSLPADYVYNMQDVAFLRSANVCYRPIYCIARVLQGRRSKKQAAGIGAVKASGRTTASPQLLAVRVWCNRKEFAHACTMSHASWQYQMLWCIPWIYLPQVSNF